MSAGHESMLVDAGAAPLGGPVRDSRAPFGSEPNVVVSWCRARVARVSVTTTVRSPTITARCNSEATSSRRA